MKDELWIDAVGGAHCSDCRFFSEVDTLQDGTVRGECHRNPPVLLHKTDIGTWPIIESHEFCGEFELKPSLRRSFEAELIERWNGRLK